MVDLFPCRHWVIHLLFSLVVSSADGTHFIPLCSSATPSAKITSSISSTHEVISAPSSAQLVSTLSSLSISTSSLFSTCMPQTPFFTTTLTETLMTSATFPSSASPIATSRGLTSLRSSTSTSATSSFQPHRSTVTVSTVRPRPSPSSTMSNSDTITLAPVFPTSTVIGPGTSQSGLETTLISSISSTPFVIPTFVSSAVFSPIPSYVHRFSKCTQCFKLICLRQDFRLSSINC